MPVNRKNCKGRNYDRRDDPNGVRDLPHAMTNKRSPTINGTIAVAIDPIAEITTAPTMITINRLAASGVSQLLMPVSQGTTKPIAPSISQIPMKWINQIGKATGAP